MIHTQDENAVKSHKKYCYQQQIMNFVQHEKLRGLPVNYPQKCAYLLQLITVMIKGNDSIYVQGKLVIITGFNNIYNFYC